MNSVFDTTALTRWLPSRVRGMLKRFINNLSDESVCRCFSFYNKLFSRWPIKIEYDLTVKAFRITDQSGARILVGRRTRLHYYSRGVHWRLRDLASQYCVEDFEIDPDDLVVDVGANIGEFSMFMRAKGARIISIEPEETEFRCLISNVARSGEVICLNVALWKTNDEVTFYSKNDSGDSSLIQIEDYSESRRCQALTLKEVIDRYAQDRRVRLLKLEAEGAEPEIILGAADAIRKIDYITVDVGAERGFSKSKTLVPVIDLLYSRGFKLIRESNKRTVLFLKNEFERV